MRGPGRQGCVRARASCAFCSGALRAVPPSRCWSQPWPHASCAPHAPKPQAPCAQPPPPTHTPPRSRSSWRASLASACAPCLTRRHCSSCCRPPPRAAPRGSPTLACRCRPSSRCTGAPPANAPPPRPRACLGPLGAPRAVCGRPPTQKQAAGTSPARTLPSRSNLSQSVGAVWDARNAPPQQAGCQGAVPPGRRLLAAAPTAARGGRLRRRRRWARARARGGSRPHASKPAANARARCRASAGEAIWALEPPAAARA